MTFDPGIGWLSYTLDNIRIRMRALTITLALSVFASACTKRQPPKKPENRMEIVDAYKESDEQIRDENHPDAKVIKQLIDAGADLSKPHKPDFQFDFPDVKDARAVAKTLHAEGFSSKIYAPQEGYPTYELVAQKEMTIELEAMADLTDRLKKLAEENNGEMSGWGTSVEE